MFTHLSRLSFAFRRISQVVTAYQYHAERSLVAKYKALGFIELRQTNRWCYTHPKGLCGQRLTAKLPSRWAKAIDCVDFGCRDLLHSGRLILHLPALQVVRMEGLHYVWEQVGAHTGVWTVGATLLAVLTGWLLWSTTAVPTRNPPVPPGSFGWPLVGETLDQLDAAKANQVVKFYATRVAKYGEVSYRSQTWMKLIP